MRMDKNTKIDALACFDPTKYLVDEEAIAAYFADVEKLHDPQLTTLALQNIQRARKINLKNK